MPIIRLSKGKAHQSILCHREPKGSGNHAMGHL